jgi:enediyne polyketide synthase
VEILEQLLRRDLPSTSVVITGRFGELPTVNLAKPELPFRRFLEQPGVFYPGVELIADSVLSSDSDPYVDEHVFHGEPLFPAVMGLEAMAQVVMALAGVDEPPVFENVELSRPVVVPRGGKNTIRIAALVREPGVIEVALRCEQTGFQADHFKAICRFGNTMEILRDIPSPRFAASELEARMPLDMARDVYDRMLFHTGRFRRVANYRMLRAKECVVQLEPLLNLEWFGRYLPAERALGCAAVRDAAIHAIQACIPHARLLPTGVRRIVVGEVPCRMEQLCAGAGPECLPELLLHAREVKREGDTFEYDLQLLGPFGMILESWEGLRLRKVEEIPAASPWPEALLAPYIERRLEELMPDARLSVSVQRGATSDESVRRLLGDTAVIHRRADGKPEVAGADKISIARTSEWTLAVSSRSNVGCDIETISVRTAETWRTLLGPERFRLAELVAQDEDLDTAATRVWTAIECLKKSGGLSDAPLTLSATQRDGWVTLRSGSRSLATCVTKVSNGDARLVLGVAGA